MDDIQLKAKEVSFFALQVEEAHEKFMDAYWCRWSEGMTQANEQHKLLLRRYNRAVSEYEHHAK